MLLTLKDDNTTGSLWLCTLFYMPSMVHVHICIYLRSAFIYNYGITDGATIGISICNINNGATC